MPERNPADRLLERVVTSRETTIDPNVIAAYVDGALSAEERGQVERELRSDPEAVLLLRALQDDAEAVLHSGHGSRGRAWSDGAWRWLLVAALLLLSLGLVWKSRDAEPDGAEAPVSLAARMADEAGRLAREAPELFEGFAPLSPDELASGSAVLRAPGAGGVPMGVLLEAPSHLAWTNAPGSREVEVRLRGPDLVWEKRVEGERVAAPTLAPGQYVMTIRPLDSLAGQEDRRAFVVADAAARERHLEALARIRASAPADLEPLLAAEYAIRHRLYAPAAEALGRVPDGAGEATERAGILARHLSALTRR